jgi:hypothetical protein
MVATAPLGATFVIFLGSSTALPELSVKETVSAALLAADVQALRLKSKETAIKREINFKAHKNNLHMYYYNKNKRAV